jgi:hypothetical protein
MLTSFTVKCFDAHGNVRHSAGSEDVRIEFCRAGEEEQRAEARAALDERCRRALPAPAQGARREAAAAAEATLHALPGEIRAQYPQISSVTVGLGLADAVATAPGSRVVMVQIRQTRQLNKMERDRLTNWLNLRLSGSDVRLSYE